MVKSNNKNSKTLITILIILIVLLLITLLWNTNILEYYLNGVGLKKPVFSTYSRVVLWNKPWLLTGKLNSVKGNQEITISGDKKLMIISRYYSADNKDLFYSRNINEKWTKPKRMNVVNSEYNEITPSLSEDGKYLFFASNRPGGKGGYDIWLSENSSDTWLPPYLISNGVNTEYDEKNPYLSVDKQVFYFNSNRPKEALDNPRLDSRKNEFDIFSLHVEDIFDNDDSSSFFKFRFLKRLEILNSNYDEGHVSATAGGNIIYFSSNRTGGLGGYDIYRSYLLNEGYTQPENLGGLINSEKDEICPLISTDGYDIYFGSNKFSWEDNDYQVFKTNSSEVIKKFDLSLLFDFLSIIFLLLIIIIIIWLLLRLLAKKSDVSLVLKCLIIALIIHLIFVLLSGIWYLGGKVSEAIKEKYNDITININTLARESVALSVREGIASLPKVKAVATTNKPVDNVAVPQQQPISSSQVSEVWQESDIVNPASSPVNVQKTIHSERTVKYTSNQKISDVKPLKFGSSQIAMEVPEGTGEQASAKEKGKASGLPKSIKPIKPTEKENLVLVTNTLPTVTDISPTSLTIDDNIKNINKNLAKSINPEKAVTSTSLEQNISSNQNIDGLFEDVSDFAGDDREVDGMMGAEGGFLLESNYLMRVPGTQSGGEFVDFSYMKNNRKFSDKQRQAYKSREAVIVQPLNVFFVKYMRNIIHYKAFDVIPTKYKRVFSESVGGLIYNETPRFMIKIDEELEVPEKYLNK